MIIINTDGENEYAQGTKTLKESDHPVYQARIELALGQNTWCYAPSNGHQLGKYSNAKQTDGNMSQFQKELALYLEKYGPQVTQLLIQRGQISLNLEIAEDALNV